MYMYIQYMYMCSSPLLLPGSVSEDAVSYCERVLELLTDLEAQLPTRRFFNTLLDNSHFLVGYVLYMCIHVHMHLL